MLHIMRSCTPTRPYVYSGRFISRVYYKLADNWTVSGPREISSLSMIVKDQFTVLAGLDSLFLTGNVRWQLRVQNQMLD